ncbi:MAG: hypothetical protein ISP83_07065 [Candidatus Poseidonia sp.]|nr:hypothetical protein [Poseidonia sp.]MBL6747472.1 hypothetical protein [Poseidonia sp.]MBL6806341.1 hypothetical protein [Poseidonia sp.]MBL6885807.1 hypothetical protein [Poseidonia sp.]MBL6892492.1 hypothetical protein [Poseidonia sp.]
MANTQTLVALTVCLMLAGCTTPPIAETVAEEESIVLTPENLSFSAPTLDRDVDGGERHDLRNSFDGPVLMLWVAAGCSGCHDWTSLIKEEMVAGNISNSTNIISVHRYASFESPDDVAKRYGDNNSSEYTPWPILLPDENTKVIDASTGRMTEVGLYTAFQDPVTPTLQVIDDSGRLVWTSRTYWSNSTVLQEALNIMNDGA